MSEWKSMDSAPTDGTAVILDVGYPWAVVGAWNVAEKSWCHVELTADLCEGEYTDSYFQNDFGATPIAWQEMPETAFAKTAKSGVKILPPCVG